MSDRNVRRVHEDREGIFDKGFEPRSSCAQVLQVESTYSQDQYDIILL